MFIALITYVGRDGYSDAAGGGITFLDAIYYSTVTVTTTGYGDIAPVTPAARAWTAFVVTPLRVLFLIVLVGTTLELLTERFRTARAVNRWRRQVKDHVIVTGYGTKGRGAVDSLLATGTPLERIVVVDLASDAVEDARAARADRRPRRRDPHRGAPGGHGRGGAGGDRDLQPGRHGHAHHPDGP